MQNQLNFTFTNTISIPNCIYHKYTLISILPVFHKHKMYVTDIFTVTQKITIVHVQMKNPTPIFTPHEEPELSSGEENDALLTKRPFSAVECTQPFRIEISSEHSSSFEEIVQNENNNNPNNSVWESQYANLTDNDNIASKPTERDTDYNGEKEPTPPLPSIDGAYSIVKSTMPLSSL